MLCRKRTLFGGVLFINLLLKQGPAGYESVFANKWQQVTTRRCMCVSDLRV